ncbi:MAG: hypothetical protein V3V40_06100 [Nitrosomonadaceae bacterium]
MNQANEMEVVDKTLEVLILGTNERRIREIGEKTKGLVISDNKTFESAKQARTEMVTVRTSINKARVAANQVHRDGISENDIQAKSLTDIAVEYEEPLQTLVKAWQEKLADQKRITEEAEQTRKENHNSCISVIRNLPVTHINASIEQIQGVIDHYSSIEITDDVFEEYAIEARHVLKQSLESLDTMLVAAKDRKVETDRQATAQAELDKQQKKLDEQRDQQETDAAQRKQEQADEDKRLQAQRDELDKQQREANEKAESEILAYQEQDRRGQLEKEQQQREEALRPDKEKLVAFADQIRTWSGPEVTSDEAGYIVECALKGLARAADMIHQQIEAL